jgi:hypothetical protein
LLYPLSYEGQTRHDVPRSPDLCNRAYPGMAAGRISNAVDMSAVRTIVAWRANSTML